MSRPDPIRYAERLYTAIRAANFSPISFLAFGNAVKDGVDFRRMPRMAAEPFMRVVGEMLDLEEDVEAVDVPNAEVTSSVPEPTHNAPASMASSDPAGAPDAENSHVTEIAAQPEQPAESSAFRRSRGRAVTRD
jgi:hypothetical protein